MEGEKGKGERKRTYLRERERQREREKERKHLPWREKKSTYLGKKKRKTYLIEGEGGEGKRRVSWRVF